MLELNCIFDAYPSVERVGSGDDWAEGHNGETDDGEVDGVRGEEEDDVALADSHGGKGGGDGVNGEPEVLEGEVVCACCSGWNWSCRNHFLDWFLTPCLVGDEMGGSKPINFGFGSKGRFSSCLESSALTRVTAKVQATQSVYFRLRNLQTVPKPHAGHVNDATPSHTWIEEKRAPKKPSGPNPIGNHFPPSKP
ncbi:hypothetical protein RIF29_32036 [Crotalaria pallida]|uniref:Uncharacterized protein n=1 Tax=Crotalaria pallida TaxID=3830 RepID=A0AAN9I276_CROPI